MLSARIRHRCYTRGGKTHVNGRTARAALLRYQPDDVLREDGPQSGSFGGGYGGGSSALIAEPPPVTKKIMSITLALG